MNGRVISAIAIALMLAPGLAFAGSDAEKVEMKDRFAEIDADGSGAITQDEWTSREKMLENPPNFFVINTDPDMTEDDKITKEEWDAFFADQ